MDFKNGGKGVAFGKVAEREYAVEFEFAPFIGKSILLTEMNESHIRPHGSSNKTDVYAFWNQNEVGYYQAGLDYAWRITREGQLTLRGGYNTTSDSREKHDISYMGNQDIRFMSFGDESTQVEQVDMLKLHSKLKPK